jgi:hypothetical protein
MLRGNTAVVNQLSRNRNDYVSYLRHLNNKRVKAETLVKGLTSRCGAASQGRRVLAIGDTTDINHNRHAGRVQPGELGPGGDGSGLGYLMHPMLVLEEGSRLPLGFGDIKLWTRDPDAPPYNQTEARKLPIEDKQSYRWIEGAQNAKRNLAGAEHVTFIFDREADIYQLMQRIPDERSDILVRTSYDRKLAGGGYLFGHLDKLPVSHVYEFYAPSTRKRTAHLAKMELKYTEVTLAKPSHGKNPDKRLVTIGVVEVREVPGTVLPGEEPIHWILYTTRKLQGPLDALLTVECYCIRWDVEQFFRTLKKKGLDIEESQLETKHALFNLTVMACEVALRTMQLMRARDGAIKCEATVAFSPKQLDLLAALLPHYEGRTDKQKNPHSPGSLAHAAWIIARMGGWKGYSSEAPPGPITFRRGLERFGNFEEAARILSG